jgi:hypothetical protein
VEVALACARGHCRWARTGTSTTRRRCDGAIPGWGICGWAEGSSTSS